MGTGDKKERAVGSGEESAQSNFCSHEKMAYEHHYNKINK